jgi:Family of unknown function (DUF6252)
MKNLILILLTTFTLSCCDKDDDKTPTEQLPAATTTGANTAGCLVNGQVFLPKGSSQFGPILSCFYQQDQDGYHFGLNFRERTSNQSKSVNISLNPTQLLEGNTYSLGKIINGSSNYISNFAELIINNNLATSNRYNTTNINIGELQITKLNTQQRIVSGTFWYDAVNASGEKVEIRDGRFDMRYVN